MPQLSDYLADEIRKEGHREAMRQCYTVTQALAIATHTVQTRQVKAALDYLDKGIYVSDFTPWVAPQEDGHAIAGYAGRALAMLQAYKILHTMAQATDTLRDGQVEAALNYLYKGDYKATFMPWAGPLKPAQTSTRVLKKFNAADDNLTVRYAVTPSGEGQGCFVRVVMKRAQSTNLILCTSPDLRGLAVAQTLIGDCLAILPAAIKDLYEARHNYVNVTIERVDWPLTR